MRRLLVNRLLLVTAALALLASASAFAAGALERSLAPASRRHSHAARPHHRARHREQRRHHKHHKKSSHKRLTKHKRRHKHKQTKPTPQSLLTPATKQTPSPAVLAPSPTGPVASTKPAQSVGPSGKPLRPAAPPKVAVTPTISGTPTEGETLSATRGTWEGTPTTYLYRWQDCNSAGTGCTEIEGARTIEYTLAPSDVGHTIRVTVIASNEVGSTPATSGATDEIIAEPPPPPAPTNTALPGISGTTTEGDTLSTTRGSWTDSPTSYTYQWQDCNTAGTSCTNISGSTSSTRKLAAADAGHTLRVIVTATNEGGSTSATAKATATISKAVHTTPHNTALPVISGTTIEGDTLKATSGTWEGNPTFAYQWQDCNTAGASCTNISGSTSSTRKLAAADVGHTLRVIVTATNEGGSGSATANATVVIAAVSSPPPPAPTNTALPGISGTTTEGDTLSTTRGSWTGSPTSYTYQWQDCNTAGTSCTNIAGSTSSTRKLAAADAGHTLRVVVTATNEGGSTSATANATATISKAVVDTGCTTTISSGLKPAIEKAAAGSTVCLQAGNYGEIELNTTKSSQVKIEPAGGVPQSQVILGFTNVMTSSNLTFEGLTIAGANSGNTSSPATHIHWIADAFTRGLCIQTPTSANIDILVEGSTFIDINSPGCGNEGRVEVNGDNKNVSGTNGVVISHDLFETASPGGCTDGVNITGGASGTQIGPGDEFIGMEQGSCDPEHVDPIQFYGAAHTTVTGDYFHGNSDGIMSPDGNGSPMTVTDDVFDTDGEYPNQIVIGGGGGDIIEHDTFGHGASIRIGSVNVGPTADNETIKNNIITGGIELTEGQSDAGWTIEYNLTSGNEGGQHGVEGKPVYVGGGSEPSTWAGWELTSTSLGHAAASNGADLGTEYFGS